MSIHEEENLGFKFNRLVNTLKKIRSKILEAFQDNDSDISSFNSIKGEILDFDLLEDDIKNIYKKNGEDGNSVLGSRLVIDKNKDLIEIEIYSQKGEKSFVNTVTAKIKRVINIPPDILAELKTEGRVELSLKLDD
ncbi:hypothetical protein NG798_00045 [Ancylothrix sp. C2]|uniref:hypothetical protein n=1 Tax=Ancylothrix sp. D3o TaxID=2953691 RepID=UPI0021BA4610|nr:hypothetical protein [Ancylothrix sp. D3o]MCT7948181.1 hypothetical protein [Ancylothrix sp. D3o]